MALAALATGVLITTIGITVRPSVCQEPCAITASITIVGYDTGRSVCLEIWDKGWDGPDANRRSCWPHSGRKVTEVHISNIPTGDYTITAILQHGPPRQAVAQLRVVE